MVSHSEGSPQECLRRVKHLEGEVSLRVVEVIMLGRRIAIVKTLDALSCTANASPVVSTARIATATDAAITLRMSQ